MLSQKTQSHSIAVFLPFTIRSSAAQFNYVYHITGAYIALCDAVADLLDAGVISENPITGQVAATSVGVWQGAPILDLCYAEDSHAEVDMNVVMTDDGRIIEIQGTGEARPFTKDEFDQLMTLAEAGIAALIAEQRAALSDNV